MFVVGFMYMYPMVRKTEIHLAVKTFAKEIRVSAYLILGPVGTHKGVELRKVANEKEPGVLHNLLL